MNTATTGPSNKSAFRILLTHLYKIMALAIGLTNLQPTATKKQSGRMLYRSLGRMFSYAISLLAFAYNSFILVQLSCIGIAESQRIRRFMQNAVSQTKRLRIQERVDEVEEEHKEPARLD